MKSTLVRVIAASSFALVLSAAVFAGVTEPGVPGQPNCKGQTTAYLAQAAKNGLIDDAFRGIGGVGRYADASVKEVQDAIDQFCAQ